MSMDYYRGMLTQTTRIDAFQRAIADAVCPGDRVLEIGCGLGTYSLFAARAGAAKVWAVEGGAIVNVAKTLARVNDVADRVEFVRGWFPGVEIPGPVDVLIFEDYSPRLIDSWTYGVLKELHQNTLGTEVRVVPARARLMLAPVHSHELWAIVGAFGAGDDRRYGLDWTPTREYIYNTPLHMPITEEDLRHRPQVLADVSLAAVPDVKGLAGEASWTFATETPIHGLVYWFDLEVAGTWLSNAPGGDPRAWGNLFLPVPEPWIIGAGDRLTARVAPEVAEDGGPSWLTWDVACGERRFRGHEFKAQPASLADMIPTSPSWIPELTREAQVELQILSLADGKRTVDEIAQAIRGEVHPLDLGDVRTLVANTLASRTARTRRAATR